MGLLINSLCNASFHCFDQCSSCCPRNMPANARPLVQHTHFAKFLLLLKWRAHSHWSRVPCSEDQWRLASSGDSSRRIQVGSAWLFRRESQPARARSCWPLQEAWREGAGGSAGAGSCRNQTQPICQVYHFEHLKCWQVCSQSMVSRALVTPWSSLTPPMFTDSSH